VNVNVAERTVDRTRYESVTSAKGVAGGIKCLIRKLVKASLSDADAIFKSKDWPYLWQK